MDAQQRKAQFDAESASLRADVRQSVITGVPLDGDEVLARLNRLYALLSPSEEIAAATDRPTDSSRTRP